MPEANLCCEFFLCLYLNPDLRASTGFLLLKKSIADYIKCKMKVSAYRYSHDSMKMLL